MASTRATKVLAALAVLVVAVFIAGMHLGARTVGPVDVLRFLAGGGGDRESILLLEYRVPRALAALLVGAGLAVSGSILQGILRNEMAAPDLLGLNAGAGLGVIAALLALPAGAVVGPLLVPAAASAGAAGAAAMVLLLAARPGGISPTGLILTGVAINAVLGTIGHLFSAFAPGPAFDRAAAWQAGSLGGLGWPEVLMVLPWILVLVPAAAANGRAIDILGMGDEVAAGLGITVRRRRALLLGLAAGLSGACVAIGGNVTFVGLLGPHIGRRITGGEGKALIPVTALAGSLLVLAADVAARTLMGPTELPAGILVSALGAPYFLYLLMRS